jgi:hypothetical protein
VSTEYFEITARNLIVCNKSLSHSESESENVIGLTPEYITTISFDNCPYEIISNGTDHYELLAKLFARNLLILKFINGIFVRWNVMS